MCEPTTLAIISIGATVASTAMGAVSAMQQGEAAKDAAKYQAGVARQNQQLANRAALDAQQRGQIEADQRRLVGRHILASQRTQFAANGIDLGSDSVEDVQGSQAQLNELDALTIENNAEREAYGLRLEGRNYGQAAQMYKYQGKNAAAEGKMNAFGTVLAGGGQVAGQWYNMGSPNPFAKKTGVDSVKWGTSSSVWNRGY